MGLFGFGRRRTEPDDDSKVLAADLYAGGERADRAVAFLVDQIAEKLRRGGDDAVELFSEWVDILMEGNEETAKKFCARVLPMLPAETRKRALALYGVQSESTHEELDPMLQSLISDIAVGGHVGADAVIRIFNTLEKVKGIGEAQTVVKRLFAGLSSNDAKSMMPYLPERIRASILA